MKSFKITCNFEKRGYLLKYSQEINSLTEKQALEKFYSLIGSKHRVKRSQVKDLKIEIL